MNVADVLKAARGEVAKGWCKNSLEDKDGNVCALGAISRAAFGNARERITGVALDAFSEVADHVPAEYGLISHYNNAEPTTQQDILNLFDKTLADLGALA